MAHERDDDQEHGGEGFSAARRGLMQGAGLGAALSLMGALGGGGGA